jgi:hypothetical protein
VSRLWPQMQLNSSTEKKEVEWCSGGIKWICRPDSVWLLLLVPCWLWGYYIWQGKKAKCMRISSLKGFEGSFFIGSISTRVAGTAIAGSRDHCGLARPQSADVNTKPARPKESTSFCR